MKSILTLALLAILAGPAWSLPITFTDPYCGGNSTASPANCNPSPDVIGNRLQFDIESLSISSNGSNNFTVVIRTNYDNAGLNPFTSYSGQLNIGDVLFSAGSQMWALVVNGHSSFFQTAGLYQVTDFLTAREALNNPSSSYRPDANVWANATGASLLNAGSRVNDPVPGTTAERLITLNFTAPTALATLLTQGGLHVEFAAATCGNDIIVGDIPTGDVPEPVSLALMGSGLAALGALRLRRRA